MSTQLLRRSFSFERLSDPPSSPTASASTLVEAPPYFHEPVAASPFHENSSPISSTTHAPNPRLPLPPADPTFTHPPPPSPSPQEFGPPPPVHRIPVTDRPTLPPNLVESPDRWDEQRTPTRASAVPAALNSDPPTHNRAAAPTPPAPAYSSPTRSGPARPTERRETSYGRGLGYASSIRTGSSTTPGMDNLGHQAVGGGITGIAMDVAATNERGSGLRALHDRPLPSDDGVSELDAHDNYHLSQAPSNSSFPRHPPPYSSSTRLEDAAAPIGFSSNQHPSDISLNAYPNPSRYMSNDAPSYPSQPSAHHSSTWDPRLAQPSFGGFDPNEIDDDGDDGLEPQGPNRSSMLSHRLSSHGMLPKAAGAADAGAVAGGSFGALRGLLGRKSPSPAIGGMGSPYGQGPGNVYSGPVGAADAAEKSDWLNRQQGRSRRMKWLVGSAIVLIIIAAVVGAVVGGVIGSRKSTASAADADSAGPPQTAAEDDGHGDLNKDSAEIKALLNNDNLHKVFPGMDYTPWGTQYPDCLKWPPSQNNVTRDLAVLSQLTNRVRLYGTDCNQTEMVLHAISQLGLTDMKVWLGVWQDNNATDNTRQMAEFYDILDQYGADPFVGIIVGNEVLFRQDMTEEQLATVIQGVKSNLTAKGINLPVATSDLGDNWTADLASMVDIVMANVHPFFAGVTATEAAAWTYDFWQTHDVALAASLANKPKNIISEVGWPSGGGNDCGASNCTSDTEGSVAGINQMNTFMDSFICQSLANGTEYFWFEAFDEPWKVQYNTPGKDWEDKWGLMDAGRNLKSGVTIPDCGGKVISS
ncbi:MAG: hypothetical protein M1838_004187 [Thelocarpon superellum]|nr:MAG: hypothetical protein M1838_004187 [Thelocarpon superellum]